jgi:hypothetical protein
MTTARDLMILAVEEQPDHPVGQGELSLALAGAELIDLLSDETARLDGDLIVPGMPVPSGDRLLDQAARALSGGPPYETVEDWLWRRGRDLAAAYLAALEEDGQLTRRGGRLPFRAGQVTAADTREHQRAAARREAGDPVLIGLLTAAGLRPPADDAHGRESSADEASADFFDADRETVDEALRNGSAVGDPAATVLAAVDDAATELTAVRLRRDIEKAAYDNIWRGV